MTAGLSARCEMERERRFETRCMAADMVTTLKVWEQRTERRRTEVDKGAMFPYYISLPPCTARCGSGVSLRSS